MKTTTSTRTLLGLDKSTISRLVAGMATKGWVTREREPSNRRLSLVSLSDTGRRAAQHAADHLHRQHAQLIAALTDQERAALKAGVTALARALSEAAKGEGQAPAKP